MQRQELSEGAPVRETGLELRVAHLVVAGEARLAHTAGADERHDDPLADVPSADLRAYLDNRSGQLVAWHVRQGNVRIVTHPAVPVRPAQARRLDMDNDSVEGWLRIGY